MEDRRCCIALLRDHPHVGESSFEERDGEGWVGDCGAGESQEANLPTFPILPRAQAPSLLNNSNLNICIWGQIHVKNANFTRLWCKCENVIWNRIQTISCRRSLSENLLQKCFWYLAKLVIFKWTDVLKNATVTANFCRCAAATERPAPMSRLPTWGPARATCWASRHLQVMLMMIANLL